jgi:tetratricopeptide (TPR) repeat protein
MTIDDRAFDHLRGLVAEDNAPLELVIDGRYEVTGRLARGGMGEVFTARDHRLGRDVAMKVLAAELSSPEWIERFRAEAQTMTRIDHPGVVPIHDLGLLPDGRAYYTMKLVEGRTLDRVIAQTRDRRLLVRVLVQVCAVVQQAHDRGIVHRDLKPANVMVGANEQVFVLDWGIARVVDDLRIEGGAGVERGTGLTATGLVLGTLQYMPPEQARGEIGAIDARSDVYALGGILYSMLTGRPPRAAAQTAVLLEKAAAGEVVPPRQKDPTIPAELEAVCLKALSPASAGRYATARELADDLRRWLEGDPVLARKPSPLYKLWRAAAKRKALSIASALAILATLSFGVYWIAHREDRAVALERRLEDEIFGPIRARLERLPTTREGRERGIRLLEEGLTRAPRSARAWMDKAILLERADRSDDALNAYTEALRINPRLSVAHYQRGRILVMVHDKVDEAAKEFEAALQVDPGNEYAQLARAQNAQVLGRPMEALAICDAVEPIGGHLAELHFLRGVIYGAEAGPGPRDPDKAIECYTSALRLDPAYLGAVHNRGITRSRKGDREGAIRDFSRAIEINDRSYIDYYNRGMDLAILGRLDEALADHERVVRLVPDWAPGYASRGDTRKRSGDRKGALADFNRALELNPRWAEAFMDRAAVRHEMGDLGGARSDLNRAMELSPRSVRAPFERGLLRVETGDHEGAIADFTRTLAGDPTHASAIYNRGNSRLALDDLDAALADFNRALELDPHHSGAFTNRADVKRQRGDLEGALADLGRAIEADPKNPTPLTNRGAIRETRGDIDGALADHTLAIKLKPDYATPYSNRGIVRMRKGDLDGALEDLGKALELNPKVPNAWNNRATVLRLKGDLEGSIRDCTSAIGLNPCYAMAHANRGLARSIKGDSAGAREDLGKALELLPTGSPMRPQIEKILRDLKP